MGAKQSKRSVDISGKEAESAGEVAAAGAGGEGRVEPLADADALKPQLNGAAHIQPDQPLSDKEKQLDSGTPENEKDATTEKEGKEEQNDKKEAVPVTNGDNETKEENGDPVPTPEDGKKPKKEKVKKKWSLRSISFSRKDKPKQEKKSKEDESKTNGEPEKVPEEAAEAVTAVTEAVENKIAEVVKDDTEVKEEKTPETPVTEPLTNGSSTPESPKVEALAADKPAPAPEADKIQETSAPELKPEQLPVNGLSLEEPKKEAPEISPTEESKPEELAADATVTAPVPEIPVKTEVCDAKMPLIEPTPPPLPANPPPSSVASFAATTMAPELIEASLANTTENAILTPPAIPDTKADKLNENKIEPQQNEITNTDLVISQLSPPLKETAAEDIPVATPTEEEIEKVHSHSEIVTESVIEPEKTPAKVEKVTTETKDETIIAENISDAIKTDFKESEVNMPGAIINEPEVNVSVAEIEEPVVKIPEPEIEPYDGNVTKTIDSSDVNDAVANSKVIAAPIDVVSDFVAVESEIASNEFCTMQNDQIPEPTLGCPDIDELPPPPPLVEQGDKHDKHIEHPQFETITKEASNANHHGDTETNGIIDEMEQDKLINKKKDALGNIETIECNGNSVSEVAAPEECGVCSPPAPAAAPAPAPAPAPALAPGAHPAAPPPAERLQDPLPIADKIADLIPEIPTVPELNTETEPASPVAVAD